MSVAWAAQGRQSPDSTRRHAQSVGRAHYGRNPGAVSAAIKGRIGVQIQPMKTTHRLGRLLVVGLAFSLCVQWPLRDGVQAYSQFANDVGQILFAWYTALSVSVATRAHKHIAVPVARASSHARWRSWALFVCVAPWAAFLLWSTVPQAVFSTLRWERFSEALTPGYFLMRIAEVALGTLALWDVCQALRAPAQGNTPDSLP